MLKTPIRADVSGFRKFTEGTPPTAHVQMQPRHRTTPCSGVSEQPENEDRKTSISEIRDLTLTGFANCQWPKWRACSARTWRGSILPKTGSENCSARRSASSRNRSRDARDNHGGISHLKILPEQSAFLQRDAASWLSSANGCVRELLTFNP